MSSTCTCMVHLSLQRFRCSCTCTCTLLHNSCIQTCTYCIHQSCEAAHDPIYLLVFQSQKLSGAYADYCAHLVVAKHVLESKKQERQLQDFLQVLATAACCDKTTCDCHHHNDNYCCHYTLQRCLDSEFSRRLDLWTFLGLPTVYTVHVHL